MPTRRTVLKSAAVLAVTPLVNRSFAQTEESNIIRKVIPSSGVSIPVIGVGTNRYRVDVADVEALKQYKDTLATFHGLGGTLIDTAQSYGNSESVIGEIISQLDLRGEFFLSTKCDMRNGETTVGQLAESADNLNAEVLDLVSIHNLLEWQTQLPILREAKAAGKIKHIGITTSNNSQHKDFGDVMESEQFDFVQLNYSLADRASEQRLLKIAAEKDIAVMVNLPFGRGALFDAFKGQELPAWAAEFDANSWAQLFLKYIVSHPAITCAIPGTRRVQYANDNFGAAMGQLPNAEQRADIEKLYDSL
ncbi:MAG: aldo/keto reductase [Acidiferrobacterales bacterium]|nr:aldo/keto reductase [Acidiferrobacterales bacterium]